MPYDLTGQRSRDEDLLQACRRGDASALERLLLKYQNRLYNVISRICSNPDDAAELLQDTFVKVIENIEKFQGKSSFYTWSFRIAVNLTLNHCRRRAKIGFRSLDVEAGEPGENTTQLLREFLSDDKSPDPEDVAVNRELCEVVSACLLDLEEMHRTVITLRDIEGMSYADIAQVLDIEIGTVRSRLSRARARLRRLLEDVLE